MAAKRESSSAQPRRLRNAAATREAILQSAVVAFSGHGYEGVGVREIARTAGVTAVLVNRYFGSKEELFAAAVEVAFANHNLFQGDPAELANRLTAAIMKRSEPRPHDPFLLLLRSAPNPRAAQIIRECIARQIERPLRSLLQGARAAEHAAMIVALVAGFVLMRKVVGNRALFDANGSLSGELRIMIQRLIEDRDS